MESVLFLMGGLGILIYGMHLLSGGLKTIKSHWMGLLLEPLKVRPYMGVLLGLVAAVFAQAGSAATVSTVALVQAGFLTLNQAVGVVIGANVGTALLSVLALLHEGFTLLEMPILAPFALFIGVTMMVASPNRQGRKWGEVLVGLGFVFVSIRMMQQGAMAFEGSRDFGDFLLILGKTPLLGVAAGAVVAGVMQSSLASILLLQGLVATGMISFESAIYILLGQNVGLTVTTLLAGIGMDKTARRVGIIHLCFNAFGALVIGLGTYIFFQWGRPELADRSMTSMQLVLAYLLFNVATALLVLPLLSRLIELSMILLPGEDRLGRDEGAALLRHLDDRIFETPSFAVESAILEVGHMGEVLLENTSTALSALFEKNEGKIQQVKATEEKLNLLDRYITDYLIKISQRALTEKQQRVVNHLFHTVNDMETVGDHVDQIADLAEYTIVNDLVFSSTAKDELGRMAELVMTTITEAVKTRVEDDADLIRDVEEREEAVELMEEHLRNAHILRLTKEECDLSVSSVYLDLISHLEHIADHALNIAYYVKEEVL